MQSKELDELEEIVARPLAELGAMEEPNKRLVEQSVEYLHCDQARIAMEQNTYWPKWDGPWWQMQVLHELGLTKLIPSERIEQVLEAFETYYLHDFPFKLDDVPEGVDPLNQVICHCQMGCTEQLLTAYGIDICKRLPWVASWYERYQLPDGGLNCDESVYTREAPKSSVVSTVPVLEAILKRPMTAFSKTGESDILKRGAQYLINRKLFRSASTGEIIDQRWTELCFPRFYFYDILRGLSFLLEWSLQQQEPLPATAILEAVKIIDSQNPGGDVRIRRSSWKDSGTRAWDAKTSAWVRKPEASYPLLDKLSAAGQISKPLAQEWNRAKANLKSLLHKKLITEDP